MNHLVAVNTFEDTPRLVETTAQCERIEGNLFECTNREPEKEVDEYTLLKRLDANDAVETRITNTGERDVWVGVRQIGLRSLHRLRPRQSVRLRGRSYGRGGRRLSLYRVVMMTAEPPGAARVEVEVL